MPYVTSFERIAKKEGILEGKIKGKLEGILEGQQGLILRQLKARFGNLPAWVIDKITASTEEQRMIWAVTLLESDRLENIFNT